MLMIKLPFFKISSIYLFIGNFSLLFNLDTSAFRIFKRFYGRTLDDIAVDRKP